jgi:transposase
MAAWKLTSKEWDAVDAFRFSTKDAREFRNALIILMSAAGESKANISADLRCSVGTVDIMRKRYRQTGVEGLKRHSPPGRTSRADQEFLQTLRKVLDTPPQDLGYGFSVWSAERLAQHLKNVTGVEFSASHLRRLLKAEGFSFQRPKHTMKGKRDEAAYRRARRELEILKKKRCGRTLAKS